jgi:uncharacterized protein
MKFLNLLLLFTFSLSACANSSLPNNRHISVTGTAKLQAKPDIAILHLYVESTQVKSLDAKREVDGRINRLLDGLAKFAIDQENVSASSISTQPNYTYKQNSQRELTGYTASRNVKLTLAKLKHLNALMDFALEMKINQIRNIELKSSKEIELKNQVNGLAVKNAKSKGQSLAEAFGADLGKIYSINSTSDNNQPRFGENKMMDHIALKASPSEPGRYLQENIVFSASISVVFDLEVD